MKLSEIKNEAALDILADILEPACSILADPEVKEAFTESKQPLTICKTIIKGHKKEIIEILARLDGAEPSSYEISIITLPARIIELLNDETLIDFFTSQIPTE